MKKIVAPLLIVFAFIFLMSNKVLLAQNEGLMETNEATSSTQLIENTIPTAIPTVNITEAKSNKISYEVEKWNLFNSFRWMIKIAIDRGVSSNTVVLLLLLPLVATLVSFLHYVVGLSGCGIFVPTMMAVAFLATGIWGGILLFALILVSSLMGGKVLGKLKIHFWPARAINLMCISIAVFGLMLLTSFINVVDISKISIFPILFMILLAEDFVRAQMTKSKKEARNLTIGTIVLAVSGAWIMRTALLQNLVLSYPGWVLLIVLVLNLMIGNYKGIRWTEIRRFRGAIREKRIKV